MNNERTIWNAVAFHAVVAMGQRSAGLRPISISLGKGLSPQLDVQYYIGLVGVLRIILFRF